MATTDLEQRLREAIVAISTGHPGLQAVLGRDTRLVVERDTLAQDVLLPVLAYDLLTYDEASGRGEVLFTAIAEGVDAGAMCRAALEQLKLAITSSAFEALGLQVAPLEGTRRSVAEMEDVRDRLSLDSPTLTQVDWSLPLLVLESL